MVAPQYTAISKKWKQKSQSNQILNFNATDFNICKIYYAVH